MGEIERSLKDYYARIWDYGAEIIRSNPNSTIKICVDRPDPNGPSYFQSMYICLDAVRRGWLQGCRPVIGLDGCFLKSYCQGESLTAIGRNENNQMFPIAWTVIEVESKHSWSWFIELLLGDLGVRNGRTVIIGQQKDLVPAIHEPLPYAEHRCCARHIYSNMRKRFTGVELKSLFWQAAKSGTPEEFEVVMAELYETSNGAHAYLMSQNSTTWSKAFFSTWLKCE